MIKYWGDEQRRWFGQADKEYKLASRWASTTHWKSTALERIGWGKATISKPIRNSTALSSDPRQSHKEAEDVRTNRCAQASIQLRIGYEAYLVQREQLSTILMYVSLSRVQLSAEYLRIIYFNATDSCWIASIICRDWSFNWSSQSRCPWTCRSWWNLPCSCSGIWPWGYFRFPHMSSRWRCLARRCCWRKSPSRGSSSTFASRGCRCRWVWTPLHLEE